MHNGHSDGPRRVRRIDILTPPPCGRVPVECLFPSSQTQSERDALVVATQYTPPKKKKKKRNGQTAARSDQSCHLGKVHNGPKKQQVT